MKKTLLLILAILNLLLFTACKKSGNVEASPTINKTPVATQVTTPTPGPTAEPTAEPTKKPWADVNAILWNFKADSDLSDTDFYVTNASMDATLSVVENEGLRIDITGPDPFFLINTIDNDLNTYNIEEYPILKIRLLNKTVTNHGEIYAAFGSEVIADANQKYFVEIASNTNEFQDMYFDFSAKEGSISQLRFDLVNLTRVNEGVTVNYDDGYYVVVEYAGFFKSMEEAKAYNLDSYLKK